MELKENIGIDHINACLDKLVKIRRKLCPYVNPEDQNSIQWTCDCKYGVSGEHEQTGCPEILDVMEHFYILLNQLSSNPKEPSHLCDKKKVVIVDTHEADIFEKECAALIIDGYTLMSSSCGYFNPKQFAFRNVYQAIFALDLETSQG